MVVFSAGKGVCVNSKQPLTPHYVYHARPAQQCSCTVTGAVPVTRMPVALHVPSMLMTLWLKHSLPPRLQLCVGSECNPAVCAVPMCVPLQGLVLRFYVYEPIIQGRLIATQAAHQQHPQVTSSQTDSSTAERRGDLQPQQPRSGNTPVSGAAAKPPTGRDSLQGSLKRRKPSPFAGPATDSMTTITSSSSSSGATAIPATATLAGPSAAVAPRWRRQLAAAATFVVSGLEHELFLWYLLRHWGYQWFLFFTLQGLLLAVEGKCKRAARAAGLQLRPFVSHLAVLLVLGVTGDVLFWPPLLQPGLVQPLLQAVPPQIATWLGWGVGSYVGST